MQTVPIQPVPSQVTQTVLGGQNCQLYIYQKSEGLFIDVTADDVEIVNGIIARDAVPIICREYAGFAGNFVFVDTQGADDPNYAGLNSRFALVYLTAGENGLI